MFQIQVWPGCLWKHVQRRTHVCSHQAVEEVLLFLKPAPCKSNPFLLLPGGTGRSAWPRRGKANRIRILGNYMMIYRFWSVFLTSIKQQVY